jgi:hypothetical protein
VGGRFRHQRKGNQRSRSLVDAGLFDDLPHRGLDESSAGLGNSTGQGEGGLANWPDDE